MDAVQQYIQNIGESQKPEYNRVCKIITTTVHDLTLAIGYGMPVYKYKGKYLIGVAAFKNHLSIFPGSGPVEAYAKQLKNYKTSKGTVQFTPRNPLPENLITDIVLHCKARIDDML